VESGEWRGEEARVDGLLELWYEGGLSGGRRGQGAGRRVALSSERRDCLKIKIEMFRFRVSAAESKLERREGCDAAR